MTFYNYKDRKQPQNRAHLGELEKHKDAVSRLAKIKESNNELESLRTEVKSQTGDEFFFAMHNCYKMNNRVMRTANIDYEHLKRQLKLIDSEILRAEKKIRRHIVKPTGKHIKFDEKDYVKEADADFNQSHSDDSEMTYNRRLENEKTIIDFEKGEAIIEKYQGYVLDLNQTRQQILEKLNSRNRQEKRK